MHKILLIALSLTVFAGVVRADTTGCCDNDPNCQDFVCQPCKDRDICPECFPDPNNPDASNPDPNNPNVHVPCCQQLSQVLALTAASVQASVNAYAGALATSRAATGVVVSSVAGASVSAFVSISQSLALSVNTGRCCEIAQDVISNATSYSSAASAAAADAKAYAEATASAASAAQAAAKAASSFYAEAKSLIESSCCGFNLEVYSAVLAAGQYALSAQGAVSAAVAVVAAAHDSAYVVASAASTSAANTGAVVKARLDNCCVSNYTSTIAGNTASTCLEVCNKADELHGLIANAFEYFASYAADFSALSGQITLVDAAAASECSDVSLSCCGNAAPGSQCAGVSDVQLASYAIADVYISAKALIELYADALAYAESQVAVYAAAIADAYTAARASAAVAVGFTVQVSQCCSIQIIVDTKAVSKAKSVATALASSNAIAQAYSYGLSRSQSIATAVAQGVASAASVVTAYYNGCHRTAGCTEVAYFGKSRLSCFDLSERIVQAFSNEYLNLVSTAVQNQVTESKSQSTSTTSSGASDCTHLIRRVSTRSAFLLQCCCCTTKNAVASTVSIGYASTKRIHGLLF